MIEKVKKIIAEELSLDESEITADMSLTDDLGMDSLDMVDLAMAFEDEFDVQISDDDIVSIKTVGDVASYLSELTDL